jgi:uncharacterized protein YyaL (SSP411 family)
MSATDAPRFTNRLAREKSPYLLQHAHNPVDWYPWGEEAFAAARGENKPIFLSVGYSACHWCHVMERESFEDEEAARLLNEHFIPVKVDREERPDVDEVYMTAVQMMTQHGGWPMSVFLTPDGRPFYGGTYFPPEDRHGRPGFKTLLRELAAAYTGRRDEVERVAGQLAEDLEQATRQRPVAGPGGPIDPDALLRRAVAELQQRFDEKEGGFGGAPKFPPHHALALLLEAARRGRSDPGPSRMLTRTLDKMALGGIYDHIGGGFHRYSTDAVWLLPHFEKMLYDNALLARVYASAFQATGQAAYARIARETCDWVLRDMTDAAGGFHAALDADSEGEEGKYYVWTLAEVNEALGEAGGAAFATRYNLLPGGNFRDEATGRPAGTNIPHLSGPEPPAELAPELADARAKLLARRQARVPPGKDDKVITSWNGLMIGGLAQAGKALGEERYLEAAIRAADFCLTTLRPNGRLLRRYRDGEAAFDAYLEDYAFLADGLLDLHDATGDARWADAARGLAGTLLAEFWDAEDGGFFFTGAGHETLIARSKDLFDGALPSPNGVAARVLARLGALPGGETYQAKAREMLSAFHGVLQRVPHGTQTLVLAATRAFEGSETPSTSDAAGDIVTLTADGPSPLPVAPGSATTAVFLLTVGPGWHINAHRVPEDHLIPTVATVASDLPAAIGPVRYPAPVPWPSEGITLPTYQGAARFEVPLALPADAAPGRYTVTLGVRFQPCGETECLPPDERTATLAVEVSG